MSDVHLQPPRPTRTVALHTVVWILACVAALDGAGLAVGGANVTGSPSYAALRELPGGMRTWGVLLLIGALALTWGIGKDRADHPRALNVVLGVGVGYYVIWAVVIPATWWQLGQVPAWGAWTKFLALTAVYVVCARAAAPPKRRRPGATDEAG